MSKVTIYADGSCLGNPGPGGWAAIILIGGKMQEIHGGHYCSTNNRMELTAVIEALHTIKTPSQVTVISDSQYVCNYIPKAQQLIQNPKTKNSDLWRQIAELSIIHDIKSCWVRGHSGNAFNERADILARSEAISIKRERDIRTKIFAALLADHTLSPGDLAEKCRVHISLAAKYRNLFFQGR